MSVIQPMSLAEIVGIATELQSLVGAQLQECLQTESEFGLGFYHERKTYWLWFDMNPQRPWVIRAGEKPFSKKKVTRPLTLFIKSRFLGRRLESVIADVVKGRILVMRFHRSSTEVEDALPELEIRLFPRGPNIIARDGDKTVAEQKPKELQSSTGAPQEGTVRSWSELEAEWRQSRVPQKPAGDGGIKPVAPVVDKAEREWKRAIEKKEKALERMREELAQKESSTHREVGEWLKAHGTLEVPAEWRDFVNTDKSLSWNIEEVFHRAKENKRKSEGTRLRIATVEAELNQLRAKGPRTHSQAVVKEAASADNFLSKAEARGRRMKVGENLEAYIGKSASDNLALLRKAQAFDYWLHLRDLPGSHAILRRPRNRNVTDAEFAGAGRWVVEQSVGKRAHELKGERFDLLIVECRYVRPIKGDKLGRVNYTNDRVMSLRF